MLIKSDGPHVSGVDPKDLIDAGLNPLALLTTKSSVTVDEGVIKRLITEARAKRANTSKYKPKPFVSLNKSRQEKEQSTPSSAPVDEHVRDVPSEAVSSVETDADKLTTWLEFYSIPKARKGLGLYYPIVDDHDNDILSETRQRCIDQVTHKAQSVKPNLARAGKNKRRRKKVKHSKDGPVAYGNDKNVYKFPVSSKAKVLEMDVDPYAKEVWRRFLDRHRVNQILDSVEVEIDHEIQSPNLKQVELLEAHLNSEVATQAIQPTPNNIVLEAANDESITSLPATENNTSPSGTEAALLEQEVSHRDPPNAYTIQEMASDQDIWRYCNHFVFGPGQLQREYLVETETVVATTEDETFGYPEPTVMSDSQSYFNYLRYRTWASAHNRNVEAKRLEETDPLQNRRSRLSGETVPVPYQTGGSHYTDWLESVRAKQHEAGSTRPFSSYSNWCKYIDNKYGDMGSVKVNYIDQDTFVERMKFNGEVSYCVFKYIEDMAGGHWITVDYSDSHMAKSKEQLSASRATYFEVESFVIDKAEAWKRMKQQYIEESKGKREEYQDFRVLSDGIVLQRCKESNSFRRVDLKAEHMPRLRYYLGNPTTFAMFDAKAKGIEERAGVSQIEHVSDDGQDTIVSSHQFMGPPKPKDIKPIEADSNPIEEVGDNVVSFERAKDWRSEKVAKTSGSIISGIHRNLDIVKQFSDLLPHEREEVLKELNAIHDEA